MKRPTLKTIALTLAALALIRSSAQVPPESAGPIQNPGMTVLADARGVQVPGYSFASPGAKPSPWQAQWIWTTGEAPGAGWFRKEVTLADNPKTVSAWLTADIKYRLYINGRLVSRGPVDMGQDYAGGNTHRWFYDSRDLTPFFRKGKNVIAAEVFRKWPIGFTTSRGQPGLLFEAELTLPGGEKSVVKSDATWRATAAQSDFNWQGAAFDDTRWAPAKEVPNVWEPLVPSEIPALMEARYPVLRIEGLPENKILEKDGSFKVVFDRVLSGYPFLNIKGGQGATVTVKAHRSVTFKPEGSVAVLEFPFMDEIAPAYTVEFKNVTGPVEILDAGAIFTSQPLAYRGAFECSDASLNRLWDVSRWAVQICLQTHHLDSPNHQEPISDPGDYLIEAMVNHYAFAQPSLTRQDIRKFAWLLKDEHYHNFHTSYSIGWLQMLLDYYDYTGDQALVTEMTPYVHELLDTYATWRGTNGILSEAPNYMFMDWVKIAGISCHHPPAVIGQGYLTAFYYHGLEMGVRVAQMAGDTARVAQYQKLRGEISAAFNRELWVVEKGLYRDGKPFQTSVKPGKWLPADTAIETFSPHVNLLATLYDLAPRERQAGIVEKVMAEKPLNTQPWFMHWVFQALDHADRFNQYAPEQLQRWQVLPDTQSFREMWNGGDTSHGWCSTPLVQMSARILGVTPATPGFKTITVRPLPCGLSWARGTVPTPQGEVRVAWKKSAAGFQLDVTVPNGAEADIVLSGKTTHVTAGPHHFE